MQKIVPFFKEHTFILNKVGIFDICCVFAARMAV